MTETLTSEELHARYTAALKENPLEIPAHLLSTMSGKIVGMSKYCSCGFSSASALLYLKITVSPSQGGKDFNGDAWGVTGIGDNGGLGDLYTDNYSALVSNTKSFAFTLSPLYSAVYFYDSHSSLLGTAQFGGLGTGAGTGGGTGKWA